MKRFLTALLLLAGCHPGDIDPLEQQPKYKAYRENDFFADGRAMRTPPEGTVAREHDFGDTPPAVNEALLTLGQTKYNYTCATCHGVMGDGDSVVNTKLSLRPAPSFHDDRLRALQASELYRIVSDGYGVMPRYATMLQPRERWAVVAYVRALQLSQHLPLTDAPEDVRHQLESAQ